MNLGPPPDEHNPFFPDASHDPPVARCSGCLKRFTADQYVELVHDENVTVCSSQGCGNEVVFI